MSWTQEIWKKSAKIYNAIIQHVFIKELASGTLSVDRFNRYLAQDEVYIGNYGRQMFEFAEMIDNPEQKKFFLAFAQSGIDSEKVMHSLLISRFGADVKVKSSIVTTMYNNHTQMAIQSKSKEISLAALLPCAWVYNEVGKHILQIAKIDDNPYKEWILEYGNENFTAGVNSLLTLIDDWAETIDESTRNVMSKVFLEATLFEYAFWDYGYYGDEKSYVYVNDLKKWI